MAHFTESVRKHAENLNIELIPIPAEMTDEMQPLDLRIFGPLKHYAARLFRLWLRIDPDVHRTKKDACADLVCAWERLTPDNVRNAFEVATKDRWCNQ